MNKEKELDELERKLQYSNGKECYIILKKIRSLEKELYPENEFIMREVLTQLDKKLDELEM